MDAPVFLKPSWRKLAWFFVVFFVAQVYFNLIAGAVPSLLGNFVSFVLNPARTIFNPLAGVEQEILNPFIATLDLAWIYLIAIILARESGNEK